MRLGNEMGGTRSSELNARPRTLREGDIATSVERGRVYGSTAGEFGQPR